MEALNEHEEANEDEPQPEIVELATLALPSSALATGLEVGEGIQLVLEASNETVEKINTEAQEHSLISAVIDLEKLSDLVGVSEAAFITGLHQDIQDNRATEEEAAKVAEEAAAGVAGEDTPLISPTEIIEQPKETTDQISLPADPFIETLADVLLLPTVLEEDQDAATEAAATTTEDEQQALGHDAFLLDVPTTDAEGNLEHHFVLALPEIHLEEESVVTAASALSTESFTFKELARCMIPKTTRLPTDVESVHLEATEHIPTKVDPSEVHLDIVVERKVPVIGYVILFLGLFALASVGAALDLQQGGVTPTMKTLWRQVATCLALSPMVLKSLRQDGLPHLSCSQIVMLAVSAMAYTYMTLAFVLSLDLTTLANAFVLSNMTSLVIIAGRFLFGLPILRAEGLGAITGFVGAAICADAASNSLSGGASDNTNLNSMLGNIVALSASFGTACYLIIAKKLRQSMDLFVFMFSIMGIGSVFLLVVLLLSEEEVSFDMNSIHGVFGWLNLDPDRLPLEIYMAVVCNCLGTTGYIAVMKYFDPIVPATVMLLEPVIGALLGTAAGTAPLPSFQTWIGDLVVSAGTFLVIRAGSHKTESIDATEALRTSEDELKTMQKSPQLRKNPLHTLGGQGPGRNASSGESQAKVIWET